ncbi:MAG: DUF488 domain-containing protein [Candidatus Lindowbacteria bacterium]|nr:DUF488 domain-containing protein [Candidatus Lindowbacteria bacterium]
MSDPTIYTIGHSNHTAEKFVELLKQHGIELVVDVRSAPYSKYSPQFGKEEMALFLSENGIEYAFHGNSLGGRPNDRSCYEGEAVNYEAIREKEWFRDGLDYVCWEATNRKLALLCAEEDPNECHRHNLVTQELLKKGEQVVHIRGDGSLEEAVKSQEQMRLL